MRGKIFELVKTHGNSLIGKNFKILDPEEACGGTCAITNGPVTFIGLKCDGDFQANDRIEFLDQYGTTHGCHVNFLVEEMSSVIDNYIGDQFRKRMQLKTRRL